MTATPLDFLAARYTLRDAVAKGAKTVNISAALLAVPTPATTHVGSHLSISRDDPKDLFTHYYRVTNAISAVSTVGMDWLGVGIAPDARQAYRSGDQVRFVTYVSIKAALPAQALRQHQTLDLDMLDYFEVVGDPTSKSAESRVTVHRSFRVTPPPSNLKLPAATT